MHDSGTNTIGVNSSHAEVRRRFSIAHELGHFLLHESSPVHIDRTIYAKLRSNKSSEGTDKEEIEANVFAAELLMPRDFIAQDMESVNNEIDIDGSFIDDFAKRYNVSVQALIHRLTNLEYIAH